MKQSLYSVRWYEEISEERARNILGSAHFDYVVGRGKMYCERMRGGAWSANNPENYAAYDCAAKAAS